MFCSIWRAGASASLGPVAVVGGVALALSVGVVAGAINGFLIAKSKVTPICDARDQSGFRRTGPGADRRPSDCGFPGRLEFIGNGKIFGIAIPFLLFLALAAGVSFLLTRTAFGVRLMLIGANSKAAVFAGLETEKIVFRSYVLSGFLASVAGLILSGRTNAAKSDYGTSYLLEAVLIAVLGGANPAGGRGTVLGVSIAVLALMFLSSGFQILRFSNFLIDFVSGAFPLLVIAINVARNRSL